MANFQRDYLLPTPATHKVDGQPRDFLQYWAAQGSDKYARIAQRRITYMQRSVAEALKSSQDDPLGEGETLQQYDEYLQQRGVDEESRRKSLILLDSTGRAISDLPPQLKESNPAEVEEHVDLVLPEEDGDRENTAPKKRKGNAITRTETLGFNPKAARSRIRETLEEGFHVCLSASGRSEHSTDLENVTFFQVWITWNTNSKAGQAHNTIVYAPSVHVKVYVMVEIRPALCLRLPRLRKHKVTSEHRPLVWAQKEYDRLNLYSQAAPAQSRLNMTHYPRGGFFWSFWVAFFLSGFLLVSRFCRGALRVGRSSLRVSGSFSPRFPWLPGTFPWLARHVESFCIGVCYSPLPNVLQRMKVARSMVQVHTSLWHAHLATLRLEPSSLPSTASPSRQYA